MILFILLILALVCFILDAVRVPSKVQLTALGLAFWVTFEIITRYPR